MSGPSFSDRPLHLSTSSLSTSPTWAPPRSPLPPHRLAKLANALGVSTPIPVLQRYGVSSSAASSPSSEYPRRSPTPAASSMPNFGSYPQHTSKYLLHVVPPLHLPHDSGSSQDSGLTPPPATASGYHSQFRRGTLVPMHPTMQSQLGAIAKEYALPSTSGIVLYLVSSASRQDSRPSTADASSSPDIEEPGPRLSEEIWKYLWIRVTKAEHEEVITASPKSLSPGLFSLGMSMSGHSSPHLPRQINELEMPPVPPVRPNSALNRSHTLPQLLNYSSTPAPSSPSSISDLRSHTISVPPSASSISQSEPGTPETSPSTRSLAPKDFLQAESFDLPGLRSQSIVPILAKVEFDIDKKRAPWYEPWVRSRRRNHIKRAGTWKTAPSEADVEKNVLLNLELVERMKEQDAKPSFMLPDAKTSAQADDDEPEEGYDHLSDTESEPGFEEEEAEELTARVALRTKAKDVDPLRDVFVSDADAWQELRSDSAVRTRHGNPHIVELALNGAALDAFPMSDNPHEDDVPNDEEEVGEIITRMSRPRPPRPLLPSQHASPSKKRPPPPLQIQDHEDEVDVVINSPPSHRDRTQLAYLQDANDSSLPEIALRGGLVSPKKTLSPNDVDRSNRKSTVEAKRDGSVFDDLDLKELEQLAKGPWDDSDPRKPQYKMKTQLDEMERRLAEFSPRQSEDGSVTHHVQTISPPQTPPSDRSHHEKVPRPKDCQTIPVPPSPRGVWPSVPVSSLYSHDSPSPSASNSLPTPQLAVNGIKTTAPKHYAPDARTSDEFPSESDMRRSDSEPGSYSTPLRPSIRRKDPSVNSPLSPTIIPLSPDPFGRFSSNMHTIGQNRQGSVYWENAPVVSSPTEEKESDAPTSSRFSADSLTGEDPSSKGSVRKSNTLKKLWRKSSKSSISVSNTPAASPSTPPPPAQPSRRTSQQQHPSQPSYPQPSNLQPYHRPPYQSGQPPRHFPQPGPQQSLRPNVLPAGANAKEQLAALIPPLPSQRIVPRSQSKRTESVLDTLHFDQDSPYPVPRSVGPPKTPPPPPSPSSPYLTSISEAELASPRTPPPVPITTVKEKEKGTVRKSILKSWKPNSTGTTSDKRTSIDHQNDFSSTKFRRGSNAALPGSSSLNLADAPASPALPEHLRGTTGPRPPIGVTPLDSSAPRIPSSRPSLRGGYNDLPSPRSPLSRRSGDESRPSFDASRPRVNGLTPSYSS